MNRLTVNVPVGAYNAIQKTRWPLPTPHEETEFCFSIVCGNSYIHWALHERSVERPSLEPTVFWKTPYLVEDELKGDSLRALYCRLTTVANQRVFGTDLANENRSPNFIQARRQAAKRRVPVIHVYVISTTSVKREQSLCFMFQQLPVRIWRLQRSDFVHDSYLQGAYETLGLDRIAAVRAAAYLYGTPTLVIDGGTALTYTALDRKGAFAGGGILAGVNMRLQGLHEKTSQLPYINPAEFRGLVEARLNKTSAPFDRYAVHDTKEAIVAGILYDITDSLLGIIQPWRKKCLSEMDESTQKNNQSVTQIKENKNRVIVLAGGDAELFQKLLAPNHSGIINLIWGAKALEKWTIVNHRNHLCHLAVTELLNRQREQWRLGEVQRKLLGRRIARAPKDANRNGDAVRRATIAGIDPGGDVDHDWFLLVYDDGAIQEVQVKDIYDGLEFYAEVSEHPEFLNEKDQNDKDCWNRKKDEANECAQSLLENSRKIRQEVNVSGSTAGPSTKKMRVTTALNASQNTDLSATSTAAAASSNRQAGEGFVKSRVCKEFANIWYFGTVTEYLAPEEPGDEAVWRVVYDDEDQEDYTFDELVQHLNEYKDLAHLDPLQS